MSDINLQEINTTGKRIKYYREQAKLSQERLAEECGCSRNSIALYETEQRNPPIKILKAIAFVLDINALYLNPEFDEAREKAQEEKFSAQNEFYASGSLEKLLLMKFRQLTEDQQLNFILQLEKGIFFNFDQMAKNAGIAEDKAEYKTK